MVGLPVVGAGVLGGIAVAGPALAAAALAGAIGLGIAAIAVAKKKIHLGHLQGHKGHGGHGSGYRRGHSNGHNHGHGQGNHYVQRKKRKARHPRAPILRAFQTIRKEDSTGCGRRLACELAQVSPYQLTEEGEAILDFIGPSIKPGAGILPRNAKEVYQLAKGLGEIGVDCQSYFALCPLKGNSLMGVVSKFLP